MRKKKIAILNAHSFDQVFTPVSYFIIKKYAHRKYSTLADYLRADGLFYFDFLESSFCGHKWNIKSRTLLFIINIFEILIWVLINKIPFKHIKFVYRSSKDIPTPLLIFTYKFITGFVSNKIKTALKFNHVYFHLSHYMLNADKKAQIITKNFPKAVLLGDADLSNNQFYKTLYQNKIMVFPFTPQERFKTTKSELTFLRKDLIGVGGSTPDLLSPNNKELTHTYRKITKTTQYHYLRSQFQNSKNSKIINLNKLDMTKDILGLADNLHPSNYYTEVFKRIKYCCFGDEISGAIAISNLEAMSCGVLPFLTNVNVGKLPLKEGLDYVNCPNNYKEFWLWFLDNEDYLNEVFFKGLSSRIESFQRLKNFVKTSIQEL